MISVSRPTAKNLPSLIAIAFAVGFATVERRDNASMQHQIRCRYLRIHESVPESCGPLDVPR
jgi:hypothetical protein